MTSMATFDTLTDSLLAEYSERFAQPVRDLAEMIAAARSHHRVSDAEDLGPTFNTCVELFAMTTDVDMEQVKEAVEFYSSIESRLH